MPPATREHALERWIRLNSTRHVRECMDAWWAVVGARCTANVGLERELFRAVARELAPGCLEEHSAVGELVEQCRAAVSGQGDAHTHTTVAGEQKRRKLTFMVTMLHVLAATGASAAAGETGTSPTAHCHEASPHRTRQHTSTHQWTNIPQLHTHRRMPTAQRTTHTRRPAPAPSPSPSPTTPMADASGGIDAAVLDECLTIRVVHNVTRVLRRVLHAAVDVNAVADVCTAASPRSDVAACSAGVATHTQEPCTPSVAERLQDNRTLRDFLELFGGRIVLPMSPATNTATSPSSVASPATVASNLLEPRHTHTQPKVAVQQVTLRINDSSIGRWGVQDTAAPSIADETLLKRNVSHNVKACRRTHDLVAAAHAARADVCRQEAFRFLVLCEACLRAGVRVEEQRVRATLPHAATILHSTLRRVRPILAHAPPWWNTARATPHTTLQAPHRARPASATVVINTKKSVSDVVRAMSLQCASAAARRRELLEVSCTQGRLVRCRVHTMRLGQSERGCGLWPPAGAKALRACRKRPQSAQLPKKRGERDEHSERGVCAELKVGRPASSIDTSHAILVEAPALTPQAWRLRV